MKTTNRTRSRKGYSTGANFGKEDLETHYKDNQQTIGQRINPNIRRRHQQQLFTDF